MKLSLDIRTKRAFHALTVIGAPVKKPKSEDYENSLFIISAEQNYDGVVWADYYREFNLSTLNEDGVDKTTAAIIDHYNLEYEWTNPGVLEVYNNGNL